MSLSTKNSAPRYRKKHNIHAVMQTTVMANCLLPVENAMAPAMVGANAAPLFSMKYSTACAELRISGKLISKTVDVTLGDENGMNKAVRHIRTKKVFLSSIGVFIAKNRKIAPRITP